MNYFFRFLLIITAAVTTVAVSLNGCKPKDKEFVSAERWQKKRLLNYNKLVYPSLLKQVKTGFLVTRLGTDITSEMFRLMNQKDQSFSHCGIAIIEDDTIFVYHAIGGEFNPDEKLKRETLYSFGHPSANKSLAIFDPGLNSFAVGKLESDIRDLYRKGVPFDMAFDYATDDKLYCAEFVTKVYSHAFQNSNWFTFSLAKKIRYVAIDDIILSARVKEINRWQY